MTPLSEIQPFDEFQKAMKFEGEILEEEVAHITIFNDNLKKVSKEDLFWAQRSTLQVWAENDYNSNLMPNENGHIRQYSNNLIKIKNTTLDSRT